MPLIKKSIDECGFGRSVVMDADGVLIGGNGVQSVIDGNTPVRVVETDGTELVVVKRTDLHTDDEKRKRLALADNAAGDNVEWDNETIAKDWSSAALAEWDVPCEQGLDENGNYKQDEAEQIYQSPTQLFPSQEYILIICEKDEFDEARKHFGLGFVADTKSRNMTKPVKCRTLKWSDYVNSNTK